MSICWYGGRMEKWEAPCCHSFEEIHSINRGAGSVVVSVPMLVGFPVDTWRLLNVVSTLIERSDVTKTLFLRWNDVVSRLVFVVAKRAGYTGLFCYCCVANIVIASNSDLLSNLSHHKKQRRDKLLLKCYRKVRSGTARDTKEWSVLLFQKSEFKEFNENEDCFKEEDYCHDDVYTLHIDCSFPWIHLRELRVGSSNQLVAFGMLQQLPRVATPATYLIGLNLRFLECNRNIAKWSLTSTYSLRSCWNIFF